MGSPQELAKNVPVSVAFQIVMHKRLTFHP